ncbi:hypothetical protein FACS189435_3890 [Bacteroidia bacterium]|nr:hypothetical protein FACS189435_3890 [Bacteroidia bacterium]
MDLAGYFKTFSVAEELDETLYHATYQIGDYPHFTQDDPRSCDDKLKGHIILLLQIDSSDDIMWGDAGVANFFISSESLRNLDFSNVIYTWNCC